jgi:prolyl oligopeptidase
MKNRIILSLASLFMLMLAITIFAANPALQYPDAPRGDAVDDFHGTKIPDPYRWLQDADSAPSQQWVAAQNDLTQKFVAGPINDKIKHELTDLWNYPRYTPPDHEGDEYFYTRNDGLQNQDVLYMIHKLGDAPAQLLDPNTLSTDGTVAVQTQQFTTDGNFLAYGLSRSGSDRQEIHVRNVATQTDAGDLVQWTKFTSIAWLHDDSGFYYNRYPQPGTVPPDEENSHAAIWWHTLGTPQEKDQMILNRPDNIKLDLAPAMTDDGAYLCVYINEGTSPNNRFYYRPATGNPAHPGDFVRLFDKADATYSLIDNVGPIFYFQTDLDAPRGKVIAVDTRDPAPDKWKTIIPEGKDFIDSVRMVNNQLVVCLLHDAYSILRIVNLDGSPAGEIQLPTLGSIFDLTGKRTDTEMFFVFSSYAYPGGTFRYDFTTKQLQLYHKSEIKADVSDYVTEQVFATSKDGTKVPLFLTHKKGIKLDGSNPTLLYGYGGFDVNETPFFSLSQLIWLEQGGVFADAVLRGGGEYGEDWHQAGMLSHKQNVFDDFIACAQWLVDNHYTSPPKLAIEGGSNGGLLVSACLLQRPDLFGAVIDQVPVTDMLRFPRFAAGVAWIPEYGDAATDADAFKYLSAYSPLQYIKPGVAYPPVLVTTADSDDRVDPSHAKKFVATLQYFQEQNRKAGMEQTNPILLRVDTKAGHGDGKPTAKYIDELSDEYAFLFRVMGIELK